MRQNVMFITDGESYLTLYSITFQRMNITLLLKHCGKRRNCSYEQFLLFPQCFILNQKIVFPFVNIYDIIALFAAEFEEPEIGMRGKGLTLSLPNE